MTEAKKAARPPKPGVAGSSPATPAIEFPAIDFIVQPAVRAIPPQ